MRKPPIEEGRRWLEQAAEDLRWAAHLAEAGGYHIACFLAQQVAEKALKAFLYAQGEAVVLGHSVGELGRRAGGFSEEIREKAPVWGILDAYYIPTRYPNGLPDGIPARVFTHRVAAEAVALADEAVSTVKRLIKAL